MTTYTKLFLQDVIKFYQGTIATGIKSGMAKEDIRELALGLEELKAMIPEDTYRQLKRGIKRIGTRYDVSSASVQPTVAVDNPTIGFTLKRAKERLVWAVKACWVWALMCVAMIAIAWGICSYVDAKAAADTRSTYPAILSVDSVDYETGTVVYRTTGGVTYTVQQDDMDIVIGEIYACTMDNMGTRDIRDDVIVSRRYQRVDLLGTGR